MYMHSQLLGQKKKWKNAMLTDLMWSHEVTGVEDWGKSEHVNKINFLHIIITLSILLRALKKKGEKGWEQGYSHVILYIV